MTDATAEVNEIQMPISKESFMSTIQSTSLNGWDTVYVVSIEIANQALSNNMTQLITSVNQQVQGELGNFTVLANFGAWQIAAGGSGQLLNLQVPIIQGSVTPEGGQPFSLDNCVAEFQLSLQFLPSTSEHQELIFDMGTAGTINSTPAPGLVVPLGFVGSPQPDPSVASIALNGIAAGLVGQASDISFAFASINLVSPDSNSWLAPKNMEYAFYTTETQNSYLAILSTAGNPDALTPVVDPDLFVDGCQSGFAFSLPLYFNNCLIPTIVGKGATSI